MSCYVYILGSRDGGDRRTYVGWTNDLESRLAAHNGGKGAKSTRGRHWLLLYVERYPTRATAMSREWHLKRDRRFRKTILDAHWHRGPAADRRRTDGGRAGKK